MASGSRQIQPRKTKHLPDFIEPMLAEPGEPFDSPDYAFEIKWDGIRALAFVEAGAYRLVNRRRLDMTDRYPEFTFLKDLPAGTILDGEVVVFGKGKSDFSLLMQREQARNPLRIKALAKELPANLIVFDILYDDFTSQMSRPLRERQERLQKLVKESRQPRLVWSESIVEHGKVFFQEACSRGLEGIVGKRLESKYQPGKRTDAWIKIKKSSSYHCAIIGFQQADDGSQDFRSLILATTEEGGELAYCGKVGSGFPQKLRDRLNQLLWSRLKPKPLVPCKIKGKWIEPGLYCRVSCMERTENGEFRAPVFEELIEMPKVE